MTSKALGRLVRALMLSLCGAAATLPLAMIAQAHHSFAAQYDSKKPVKMEGVVTKVEWTNPHVYLYIDVKDKRGAVANWGFEMGPPHMLQKAGWKKNTLGIGDSVEIEGWQARDGSTTANARRVMNSKTREVLGAASSAGQTLTGSSQPAPSTPAATTTAK